MLTFYLLVVNGYEDPFFVRLGFMTGTLGLISLINSVMKLFLVLLPIRGFFGIFVHLVLSQSPC